MRFPAFAFAFLATLALQSQAASSFFMVAPKGASLTSSKPSEEVVSVALLDHAPLQGSQGKPFQFDFGSLAQIQGGPGAAAVTFSVGDSPLPQGLSLTSTGMLIGTPAIEGSSLPIAIRAAYGVRTAERTYALDLERMTVSLAEATLPALAVGKSASFDFKSLTTITGGPGMGAVVYFSEWLPDGLELSDDGVLSGRPAEGGEFRIVVIAIYSQSPSVIGPQSYLVQIGQGGGRN